MDIRKKALIIVAHPDDETIWMGGTILSSKNIDWTIFCLCRGDDPVRGSNFRKACEYYNARGIISNLEDQGLLNIERSLPEIKKRLLDNFAGQSFEYIFTHNYNGEYGHERHSAVHLSAKELVNEKQIVCEKMFFFSYQVEQDSINISNSPSSNFVVALDDQTLTRKKSVIDDIYNLGKDYFDKNLFLRKETFIYSGTEPNPIGL